MCLALRSEALAGLRRRREALNCIHESVDALTFAGHPEALVSAKRALTVISTG
jgi:hypothetical protein